MRFEDFQDDRLGGSLRNWTRTITVIRISLSLRYHLSSLGSIRLTVREQMSFQEFKDIGTERI